MRPWLSVLGLYKYDNTIFDKLTLPLKAELRQDLDLIEPAELDKNLLIGKILMDLGELSLIYSDPDILKDMIEIWGDVNHDNFLALWETLLYKYNPIWNKDGTITEQRAITRSGQTSGTLADMTSGSKTGSASENRTTITDSDTTGRSVTDEDTTGGKTTTDTRAVAHNVTGFDTNSYSPDTQDVNSGTISESSSGSLDSTVNATGSEDTTVTDALQHADTETTSGTLSRTTGSTSSGSDTESYNRVEQGNIGVTTTQQMIREQREIVQFNLYQFMTESFKQNFCLMVW